VKTAGWMKGLRVTANGAGIVSHAGLALIRALADNTGLIADGGEVIGDVRVIGDQEICSDWAQIAARRPARRPGR
jgi:hypothetical protein